MYTNNIEEVVTTTMAIMHGYYEVIDDLLNDTDADFGVDDNDDAADNLRDFVPRSKRKKFDHKGALFCIKRDYLGTDAIFSGTAFKMMFRISRDRFLKIYNDISASDNHFFWCL